VTGLAARARVVEALAAFCVAEAGGLSRRERRPVRLAEVGS
jgi:hypothetical protein